MTTHTDFLGRTVTDKITGFTGVVTGFIYYVTGYNQALVAPPVGADGKPGESQWFDQQRLDIDADKPAVVLNNVATPGPAPARLTPRAPPPLSPPPASR